MDITEQRYDARIIKLERLPLPFGPRTEIVPELLVAADRRPEDVVRDAVAIEEFDRCALHHCGNMRNKHQPLLVDGDMLSWSWEGLAGDGLDVDNGLAADAGDLAMNGAGKGCGAECRHDCK